jgi:hypothetical protein
MHYGYIASRPKGIVLKEGDIKDFALPSLQIELVVQDISRPAART